MKNWQLTILSIIVVLVIAEIGARFYIAEKWPEDRVRAYTQHAAEKGRYSNHPYLPYALRRSHASANSHHTNNSYGFRGKEFEVAKPPGVFRIVAIGASTTYGAVNSDQKTYPAQLERRILQAGFENVEVLNAGVTGYTTTETFINFYLRVLNLSPDMVIFYQARNDVFPQAFNGYAPDFSHYRQPDYSFANTNYLHKHLFKISHLFMGLATRGGGNFGWSARDENPNYGTVRFDNRPTNRELVDNLSKDEVLAVYRKNIESIIALARRHGDIDVVLSTYAFRKENYESGVIERDESILSAIAEQIDKLNDIVRHIAAEQQLVLVDTARELEPRLDEYLVDDCHFNDQGQIARAALIFDRIQQFLPRESVD